MALVAIDRPRGTAIRSVIARAPGGGRSGANPAGFRSFDSHPSGPAAALGGGVGGTNNQERGAAMAKKKMADLLVQTLAAAGVERIYGVSGDSLNGITDSIRRQEQIQWIHVRHEETAAFAAGAEAISRASLAVCAGVADRAICI